MAAIIEVEGLTKSYGPTRALDGVSFAVEQGEVFGFLGPNGAGKTTTIRILMGLIRAGGGVARVAGLDCWQQSVQIKRLVGYVPGEPSLDPNLTGGQIIEYFANLRGGVDRGYVRQLIERFGLDTGRRFRQYSTGNKTKVVLIQAFMHRPEVLILDEPTEGLDPLNRREFDRLVEEARAQGSTIFLSSHILGEVERSCSRVGIIRQGRLVKIGGIAELKEIRRIEVTITFEGEAPAAAFEGLPGVSEVETTAGGRSLRLALQGPADPVIKTAARYPVLSLESHEPSLEDVFMRYYSGDGLTGEAAEEAEETAGVV